MPYPHESLRGHRKPGLRLSTIVGSCYYVAPEVSAAAKHTAASQSLVKICSISHDGVHRAHDYALQRGMFFM